MSYGWNDFLRQIIKPVMNSTPLMDCTSWWIIFHCRIILKILASNKFTPELNFLFGRRTIRNETECHSGVKVCSQYSLDLFISDPITVFWKILWSHVSLQMGTRFFASESSDNTTVNSSGCAKWVKLWCRSKTAHYK